MTYPRAESERALNEDFVTFRPRIDAHEALARRFLVGWTPGLVFLDGTEAVHYRAFGFHPPAEFDHLLRVARGTIAFQQGDFARALEAFSRAADDPRHSALRPEAIYWQGVSRYKTGDKDGLAKTWSRLLDLYPDSLWAQRASVIRPRAGAAA
ncbi:MAG TPA: tetratricopeptide repeat protein [Planctomycetota bacterium]